MTNSDYAVLFDLDGTLVDSAPDFHRIINQLLRQYQATEVDYSVIRQTASNGSRAMIEAALGDNNSALSVDLILPDFLKFYHEQPVMSGGLFEGLDALLHWLDENEISWGIVTNKPRYLSEAVLEQLKLTDSCSVLVCPEDIARAKPDPEGLVFAAKQLGLTQSHCLYLGDHVRDIEAGRAAQMTTIACGFGYLSPEDSHESWQADFCVNTTTELNTLVPQLLKQYLR